MTEEEKKRSSNRPQHKEDIVEVQAIGHLLTQSKSSRMDLMDGMYNRWTFEDDHPLPQWFVEDDSQARIPELPVTKEFMQQYRAKLREISERPIRKVAEAKARKKARATKKLQALKAKAAVLADSTELTEGSKARAIQKLVKKAKRGIDKKRDKTYSVTRAAGGNKSFGPRGAKKGTSGRCVVVDRRLKKDKRALKGRKNKKAGKGRK